MFREKPELKLVVITFVVKHAFVFSGCLNLLLLKSRFLLYLQHPSVDSHKNFHETCLRDKRISAEILWVLVTSLAC